MDGAAEAGRDDGDGGDSGQLGRECRRNMWCLTGADRQLDDLPPMMFIKDAPNSHGFVAPQVIEQKWKDHFTYLYREEKDGFILPLTIHPDVSGRPRECR